MQGLNLTFENNAAFQYGGGIYYVFPPSLSVKNSRTCFLQYDSGGPVNVSEWNITVTFRNNVASQAGDAIYISTADECIWEMEGDPFVYDSRTPFHYEQNNTGRITATPPKSMYPNLTQVERDDYIWYSYSVMPGRKEARLGEPEEAALVGRREGGQQTRETTHLQQHISEELELVPGQLRVL